jgi:PAS domain S-box-containing protein
MLRDITDRQRAAESLQRAKAWSDDVIRLAPALVVGVDATGKILLFNDYAEVHTGYAKREVLGSNWIERFVPLALQTEIRNIIAVAADTGDVLRNNEHPILLRDGSERLISWHSQTMLEDGELKMVLSFGVDVTERRRAEHALKKSYAELKNLNQRLEEAQNQLLQSEKMASIGQLAAGVAHEINNPVGFVNSNLGTLKKYCEQMLQLIAIYQSAEGQIADPVLLARIDELKRLIDIDFLQEDLPALISESEDGLLRVRKIVQDLKDFSHVNESDWQYADLNAGLESTLNVVWNEVKYKARVVKQYGTIPPVECLAAQLNQVFMNLIVNAVHAFDESQGMGTLTLSSGQEGEEVWVEVCDNGKGMSEEVRKRIFEPFFTTKPIGKGTGLGLSLSFNIIQKHQGRIEVESTLGKGTCFRVWVPINRRQTVTA